MTAVPKLIAGTCFFGASRCRKNSFSSGFTLRLSAYLFLLSSPLLLFPRFSTGHHTGAAWRALAQNEGARQSNSEQHFEFIAARKSGLLRAHVHRPRRFDSRPARQGWVPRDQPRE